VAGIVIVGCGAAGVSAALALRELGHTGALHIFGSEPAPPYERPALSKRFLVEPDGSHPPALGAPQLADAGVSLELGCEVVAVDAEQQTVTTGDGRRFGYDRLLLATGAAPRRLGLAGAGLDGVHYLRELADARRLRSALMSGRRVAIIGGGVIGLEVAASAIRLGLEVTVVEAAPCVMGRVAPPALATLLEELHRSRGVAIRTGVRPVALEGSAGCVRGVALEDGDMVRADTVLVGVGVEPRTGLASRAGVAVDDGIVVDGRFRTTDDRVFAAGDAASVFHEGEGRHLRIEQWRPAEEQGRHAAASMLGRGEPYRDVPWMWSDQHDLHVQATGFGFAGAEVVRRGDPGERGGVAFFGVRDARLVAACGVSLGTGVARTIRAAQTLIEHRVAVDAEELADPGFDLRRAARATRAA
jgi:3-phenylpropionate/trans-cinnamate dioxygenase ferredoxin reductase component